MARSRSERPPQGRLVLSRCNGEKINIHLPDGQMFVVEVVQVGHRVRLAFNIGHIPELQVWRAEIDPTIHPRSPPGDS